MSEARRSKSQLLCQINLLRRREQQVATAHYLRDAHQRIVHHHRQLVSPRPVLASHDEVAALRRQVDGLLAVVSVDERHDALALLRHTHTYSRRSAMRPRFQIAARPLIHHAPVAFVRSLRSQYVRTRAVARIRHTTVSKFLQLRLVYLATLALIERTLVPRQAEPFEVAHNQVGILHTRTLRINILNTQYPFATLRLYRKPRQQRTEHIAQMHTSRRRRRKATSLYIFLIVHLCFIRRVGHLALPTHPSLVLGG